MRKLFIFVIFLIFLVACENIFKDTGKKEKKEKNVMSLNRENQNERIVYKINKKIVSKEKFEKLKTRIILPSSKEMGDIEYNNGAGQIGIAIDKISGKKYTYKAMTRYFPDGKFVEYELIEM